MNLDLFNDLKEDKFVHNFRKELSDYLEKNLTNNTWNNLLADNLEIDGKKIISKYKDEMLLERVNMLQDYALKTKNKGEMYYVYDISTDSEKKYNLCICESSQSHKVITKEIEDLPEGTSLGSVLRKRGEDFILEKEDTRVIGNQINNMIKEKIDEQDEYLDSKRIEGHIYEVDEKDSGRILLYDLNSNVNGSLEGIEEIEFPENLYETAKKGDKFIYKNGEYQKYELGNYN